MWPIATWNFDDYSSLTYALTDSHPDGAWFIMALKRGERNQAQEMLDFYNEIIDPCTPPH